MKTILVLALLALTATAVFKAEVDADGQEICCDGQWYDGANTACADCNANCAFCMEVNDDHTQTDSTGCITNLPFCAKGDGTGCLECVVTEGVEYTFTTAGCHTCSDENCKSCKAAAETCDACNAGYVLNAGACTPCSAGCDLCTTSNCMRCAAGYISNIDMDADLSVCQECTVDNCATCTTDGETCETCEDTYVLDSTNNACESCGTECAVCTWSVTSDADAEEETYGAKCTSCNSGFGVKDDACATCATAATNCATCSLGDTDTCSKCADNFYLTDDGACSACHADCIECSGDGEDECTACDTEEDSDNGYMTYDSTNKRCWDNCMTKTNDTTCEECNDGYFLASGHCLNCADNCTECTTEAADGCTACADNYMLSEGACTVCTVEAGCKTCSAEVGKCDTCMDGEFLSSDVCYTCDGSDGENAWNCAECADATEGVAFDGETDSPCSSCLTGYYLSTVDGEGCLSCPYGCGSCTSNVCAAGDCTANEPADGCVAENVTECQAVGVFYNADDGECQNCGSNCLECGSATVCSTCYEGYYLNASSTCTACTGNCLTCVLKSSVVTCTSCKDDFVKENGDCSAGCSDNCDKCSFQNTCETCDSGYVLTPMSCTACSSDCKTCEAGDEANTTKCTVCNEGFYLMDDDTCSQCLSANCTACADAGKCDTGKCPDATYIDADGMCQDCTANCTACTDGTACDANMCAEGFYNSDDTGCSACLANCKSCSSATQCTTCMDGFMVNSTNAELHACDACGGNCKSCSTAGKCSAPCDLGFVLNATTELCEAEILACDEGMYLKDNKCEACGEDCDVCTATACTKCAMDMGVSGTDGGCAACGDGFDANGYNCDAAEGDTPTICDAGYGLVSDACVACGDANCMMCDNDAALCTLCARGYSADAEGACNECAEGCAMCNSQCMGGCTMCFEKGAIAPKCGPKDNGMDGSWAFIDGEWVFTAAEPVMMGEDDGEDEAETEEVTTAAAGDSANILKFFATILVALIALL